MMKFFIKKTRMQKIKKNKFNGDQLMSKVIKIIKMRKIDKVNQ